MIDVKKLLFEICEDKAVYDEGIDLIESGLMDSLAVKVKSGGLLLYSTCSIEREEDGEQAERFLVRHPDFELVRDRLLLPGDHHDGAYAAMFRKHAAS